MTASSLLEEISDVGRDPKRGGYSRHAFDAGETELRAWFVERAGRLGLGVETDRNGNIWAWWGTPGPDAVVTGSHLDSVPGGGAFDGPLGVASALDAVEILQAKGFRPAKPFAVAVFAEEEGGRFGVPCLGSRLLTGTIDADKARNLRDPDGVTFAEAAAKSGLDPARVGRDSERLGLIGRFLELHVEQGRGLIDLGSPIAVGNTVIAHGRWRFSFEGQGNHAGATLIGDRRDPMIPAAETVLAVRKLARTTADARATVGRLVPVPGGTNVIASTVDLWLDARVPGTDTPELVAEIAKLAEEAAGQEGCRVEVTRESYSDDVIFDDALRRDLGTWLGGPPELPTGAGHDAAILAGFVPSGMLYVRNPTGISHSPEEFSEAEDVDHGARALADALEKLST
ncbi:allantoate amidohydrolase [Amycolatopsis umgeniensis]|uniref:N-carbamoyl-L-amino-acid hydrolase n=1 Tax=Amycolatopsis umgeniensis TaxID=336628 RepID=A0A841BA39_9PSEU|nr:N-carbamoyl-L-amino-acid hydrolase [Amycolatopsis umgeniensis]